MSTKVNRDALCFETITRNNKINLLNEAPQYIKTIRNREYPCLLLRGTLTIEAAFCGTVFFLVFFSLLSLFPMMTRYNHIEMKLADAVQEYAVSGTKLSSAKGLLSDRMLIRWQEDGICCVEEKKKILFISAFVPDIKIYAQMRSSSYSGVSMVSDNNTSQEYVYITNHGTLYHKLADCVYLKPDVQSVKFYQIEQERNSSGEKYRCCEKCSRSKTPLLQQTVYITSYGNRWHIQKNCSGIQHNVRKVRLSEVGELPGCSKCSRKKE